jgi:hypothetical protein
MTHGRRVGAQRLFVTLATALALGLPTVAQARAMTVTHSVHVSEVNIRWPCPGRDPVEHATTTFRITEYRSHGVRVRRIEHWHWSGRMENRDTGELLHDDGDWTVVLFYGPSGNRVVRITESGVVWRLTVPGEGIIVHQSGRLIRTGDNQSDLFTSTFGGRADPSPMCAFV